MNCVYCGDFIDISIAEYNVLNYGGVARVASPCCGKPIGVKRVVRLEYFQTIATSDEDDWGKPYSKDKH